MLRSTPARLASALVLIALVLFGAWSGWKVWHVQKDLKAAVSDATRVRDAASSGDTARLDALYLR